MSVEIAHHHFNAAEQLTKAVFHHREAQKFYETGHPERATHHARLAEAHQHYASAFATEANKAYLNAYGASQLAASVSS